MFNWICRVYVKNAKFTYSRGGYVKIANAWYFTSTLISPLHSDNILKRKSDLLSQKSDTRWISRVHRRMQRYESLTSKTSIIVTLQLKNCIVRSFKSNFAKTWRNRRLKARMKR